MSQLGHRLCRSKVATNSIRRPAERVRIKVRVAGCSGRLDVPQQLPDDWKPKPCASADARVRVPQVMDTNAVEPSAFCYGLPEPFQVCARLFVLGSRLVSGNDMGADARKIDEYFQSWGVQDDRLLAGLAIGQQQHPSFEIDVLPSQVQDLAESGTSEEQKPHRRRGMWP